ncbi:MAG: hypothetical protein PWQ50_507 [Methanolobus sp.]|nr:hypothetical protein [Methanolobus sp.]
MGFSTKNMPCKYWFFVFLLICLQLVERDNIDKGQFYIPALILTSIVFTTYLFIVNWLLFKGGTLYTLLAFLFGGVLLVLVVVLIQSTYEIGIWVQEHKNNSKEKV